MTPSGGRRGRLPAAFAAGVSMLALASSASAADPGRWTQTGTSTIPLVYYQGITSDPARNVFFNGHVGVFRTDSELNENARNDDVIPPEVHATEQYNHIGDLAWDEREGGRLLLPLECYYPRAAPGRPDPNNTCETGSVGVADPQTLKWRYYVKLDPAEIPKVMWNEVSPDGKLLWTQSGNDLLAYSMDEITAANAAPLGPKLKAVRRLPNAKPPSGITGAVFLDDGRLYVAGQQGAFQVWSIDLETGQRRLEIEKQIVGESEGLDAFEGRGGTLHWMILPYNEQNVPTYGIANGALLHFVPRGQKPTSAPAKPARVRITITPRRIRAGRRTRLLFRASVRVAGRTEPAGATTIRLGGQRVRTNSRGRARMNVRMKRPGRYFARARRAGLRRGSAAITVVRVRTRR